MNRVIVIGNPGAGKVHSPGNSEIYQLLEQYGEDK